MSRTRVVVATLALTLLSPLPLAQAQPLDGSSQPAARAHYAADPSAAQQALLAETNRYRASRGLPPLALHPGLVSISQGWAQTLADDGKLRHNPNYSAQYPGGWHRAAENVGTFSGQVPARDMLQAWLNSPSHRRHLDDPGFTHVGHGWATTARGEVYAVQNFATY